MQKKNTLTTTSCGVDKDSRRRVKVSVREREKLVIFRNKKVIAVCKYTEKVYDSVCNMSS
jgi:hypothetical protein